MSSTAGKVASLSTSEMKLSKVIVPSPELFDKHGLELGTSRKGGSRGRKFNKKHWDFVIASHDANRLLPS